MQDMSSSGVVDRDVCCSVIDDAEGKRGALVHKIHMLDDMVALLSAEKAEAENTFKVWGCRA